MVRILIAFSLLLSLVPRAGAEPESEALVLPGYFTVAPGGNWSEPKGEQGTVGPTHLVFQAFTSARNPDESLILSAVKILHPEKISNPAMRTMDAKKMVQFMVSSLRPANAEEKLEKTKPTVRTLEGMAPAKYFYSLTLGKGEEAMTVSGITMEAEKGASAIQIVRPKVAKGDRYGSTFWRGLIKTIKPLGKGQAP